MAGKILRDLAYAAYQMVEDLVSDDGHHVKGHPRTDRVYNHVAMDADEMLRIENGVLILPS